MIDRKELKADARAAMRETKPHPVWVTLAVTAILLVVQVLSLSLNGSLDAYRAMYESAMTGNFIYVEASGSTGFFPWLLTVALDVMSMVLGVGYVLYTMRLIRRQGPGYGDVFDGFGVFFRAVAVSIIKPLVIVGWSLLFTLPVYLLLSIVLVAAGADVMGGDPTALLMSGGLWEIVLMAAAFVLELIGMLWASYRYRLAEFILLDHPELSPGQCLSFSRMAMKGWKWELFKLDLSFLGWYVLSLIPLVGLWVRPYHAAAAAGWYDRRFPAYMEEFKAMWQARQSRTPGPGHPGGWSVPGQGEETEDPSDDPDDRWMGK